jgi:hypothetical protein
MAYIDRYGQANEHGAIPFQGSTSKVWEFAHAKYHL